MELALAIAAKGISPLEVMIEAMNAARDAAIAARSANLSDEADAKIAIAAGFARDAAPYMHPRLQAITAKVDATHHHAGGIDAPIPETREEWLERRRRDLGASLALVAPVGTAD